MMIGMEDGAASLPTTLPPVEFLVLGRVAALRDGRELPLGRRRERSLLAVLLLAAGQVVRSERLVDLLWDGDPPATARAGLHTHVSRLRACLGPYGVEVSARDGGYCVEVDPLTVDAHRFVRMVGSARELADPAPRAERLRAALALWRGEALADTATDLLRSRVTAELAELRFAARELAIEADLARGRHADLVGELTALTAEYPLREELWAHLLLALHRGGRQAEALDVYARARRCLADQLGVEPGPRLRQVHQDILTAKAKGGGGAAYHQLPRDIAEFTGREAELRAVHRLAAAAPGTAVTIVAIEGMGGVGKTRLAIRAAHQLTDRYADLQLWMDLRGFDPERQPVPSAAALETFLRLLGVPDQHIPPGQEERAALYRDRLAGRRALVVLDNAADDAQVRPLLPASAGSLVLITSRRSLAGLDGVHCLPLRAFAPAESVDLLARVAGHERVAAEPEAALRIAELCGQLPIAVGLAARRLRGRPSWRLADLLARLDLSAPVHAIFDLSYDGLSRTRRRLFRLLGLHPGDDVTPAAAAALADLPVAEAEAGLESLLDEHLLDQSVPGRYRLHDYLRAYARERSLREDSAGERDAALGRLVACYLDTARQATRALRPTETRRVPPGPAESITKAESIAWVDAEHQNLVAAATADLPAACRAMVVSLVLALYWPLANRGLSGDRVMLNELAADIARDLGDARGEAQATEDLGTIWGQIGRFDEAVGHNRRALVLWRELGDPVGEQGCLSGLGLTYHQQGRFDEALECLDEALTINRRNGFRVGEASVLNYLGLVHQGLKEFDLAVDRHRQSAAAHHELGNTFGEAVALANLSWAHQRAGCPAEAIPHHERGLDLFRTLGDRYNEAEQHWGLGEAHLALGRPDVARAHHHRAIDLLEEINLLSPAEATSLRDSPAPPTPEIIRLNT